MSENGHVKQSKWTLILSVSILVGLVLSYFIFPSFQQWINEAYRVLTSENEQRISNWVDQIGFWGPLFIVMAMILQMFLFIIPSPILMVVAVLAYGPYWGAVISVFAIFCAATVGFFLGGYLSQITLKKWLGEKKKNQIGFYVERYGFWAVAIFRISPLLSNDGISVVSGMLKMSYWKFISATLTGITPLALLIAYFGENNERLKSGLLWVTAISALLLVSYIVYDRRKHDGKSNQ